MTSLSNFLIMEEALARTLFNANPTSIPSVSSSDARKNNRWDDQSTAADGKDFWSSYASWRLHRRITDLTSAPEFLDVEDGEDSCRFLVGTQEDSLWIYHLHKQLSVSNALEGFRSSRLPETQTYSVTSCRLASKQLHSRKLRPTRAVFVGSGPSPMTLVSSLEPCAKRGKSELLVTAVRMWDIKENRFARSYSLPTAVDEFTAFAAFKSRPFFVATYPDDQGRDCAYLWSTLHENGPALSYSPFDVLQTHHRRPANEKNRFGGAVGTCCDPMTFAVAYGDHTVVVYSESAKSDASASVPCQMEAVMIIDIQDRMLNLASEAISFLSFSPGGARLLIGTSLADFGTPRSPLAELMVIDMTKTPPEYVGRLLNAPSVRRTRLLFEGDSPKSEEGEVDPDDRLFGYSTTEVEAKARLTILEQKTCAYHHISTVAARLLPCWTNDAHHLVMGLATGGFGIWDARELRLKRVVVGELVEHVACFQNHDTLVVTSGSSVCLWQVDPLVAGVLAKRRRLDADISEIREGCQLAE